jgi:hypothetical protein
MEKISYRGYRFPPEIIQQAIWLYLRFTLSLRDVEDLLAERGIMVSYETVRRWVNHFGPLIAADLRKRRPKPHTMESQDDMSVVNGATIEPRIRINQPDDENARCRVSSVRGRPKDFSQRTQPPTTLSTSNAISFLQGRTERFARRQ